YTALMETEDIGLSFTDGAIRQIAEFATLVNERTENIGARRLHTVMEKLLDEISFEGPDLADKQVVIDEAYVTKMLADIVKNEDLSGYLWGAGRGGGRGAGPGGGAPPGGAGGVRRSRRSSSCRSRRPTSPPSGAATTWISSSRFPLPTPTTRGR